ncbi:MAG: hypothetical protein AB1938_29070 [Myxococcota bacterium]
MWPLLLLALSASPPEDAQARLESALQKELASGLVALRVDRDDLVLSLSSEALFEKKDPLWKVLHAMAAESKRRPPVSLRVDLAHPDVRVCGQRRDVVNGYLFDKQKADPARLSVRATCGEVKAEVPPLDAPAELQVGPLTVEARRFTFLERSEFSAVSLHVTNSADAGADFAVDAVELLLAGEPPRAVKLTGLWFHPSTPGGPYTEVKKDGVGPNHFLVPPGPEVEVMLRFPPAANAHRVAARRVRFTVQGKQGVVAGPVTRVGFHDGEVPGR